MKNFTIALFLVGLSCEASTQDAIPERPWPKDGQVEMALDLYGRILKDSEGKNVFISPTSIALALMMAYNGALQSTQADMAKALRIDTLSKQEVSEACATLLRSLQKADPQVELAIANSIWIKQGYEFLPAFEARMRDYFSARIQALDFAKPDASKTINAWVKDSTRGRIESIVPDSIDPLVRAYLINAIYMKAPWSVKFDEKLTRDLDFHLADGSAKKHPLMGREASMAYQQTEDFQAVRLPYGKEKRLAMVVFLPKDLKKFHESLTPQNWAQWMSRFQNRSVSLRLPRFTLSCSYSLNESLKSMGMSVAFGGEANFLEMIRGQDLYISDVRHKTFVEVKEEGTEAAAVTSVEMRVKSAAVNPEPIKMIVDRPFFCAVVDDKTGAILFMGSILDPGAR